MRMKQCLRPSKLPKENQIKVSSILILIFAPILLSMNPQKKEEMEKGAKQTERMVGDGKQFVEKLKRIRRTCRLLEKKFHGKKNCQKYSDEITREIKYVQNTLAGLKHPFWAYLKGAAKYAEHCALCNKKETKKYCPLFDKALERYDVFY